MKQISRFHIRSVLLLVSLLAIGLAIVDARAARQRTAVLQLQEFDATVYFASGQCVEATDTVDRQPNHFCCSATEIMVDVTFAEVSDLIPVLRQLPALKKIVLSYQGDKPERPYRELRRAFPRLKIEMHEYILELPTVG